MLVTLPIGCLTFLTAIVCILASGTGFQRQLEVDTMTRLVTIPTRLKTPDTLSYHRFPIGGIKSRLHYFGKGGKAFEFFTKFGIVFLRRVVLLLLIAIFILIVVENVVEEVTTGCARFKFLLEQSWTFEQFIIKLQDTDIPTQCWYRRTTNIVYQHPICFHFFESLFDGKGKLSRVQGHSKDRITHKKDNEFGDRVTRQPQLTRRHKVS
mmetsp:Transcript_64158/g.73828  ORF Transcript_64158/g.73828 Transcript_64158/m.73828 type:complete len:209 (+) Transcript_64158:458-1084(+)